MMNILNVQIPLYLWTAVRTATARGATGVPLTHSLNGKANVWNQPHICRSRTQETPHQRGS